MNKVRALLATATTILMLGCASPGIAQDFMENPKFLRRAEPVLGLNVQELRKVLGTPREVTPGACAVPYEISPGELVPVVGNAWLYQNETATTRATMVIWVVNNHAVAENRTVGAIEGTRIFTQDQMLLDTDLIERAFKGELDESSHEDRTIPRYNGPEYEI